MEWGGDWGPATGFRRPLLPEFSQCTAPVPLAAGWPTFVAYSFTNDTTYDAFQGFDLTPWNSAFVPPSFTDLVGPIDRLKKVWSSERDVHHWSELTYHCSQTDRDT